MAFLQDDDAAFEAALAFLDQLSATITEETPRALSKDALLVNDTDQDTLKSPKKTQRQVQRRHLAEDEKQRRKAEFNEKRKLLRKAGVYGDANRARNERAREIAHLRAQTEKLQIDLQILQTRRVGRKSNDNENVLAKRGTESQITSMWQGLAEQQRRRREEAERDNVLLRLAVERQRKVASNLQTQMQRRATQLTNECASLVTTARAHHHTFDVLDFCGDIENFRGLFRRLDDAYEKMDDVFMMNGLGSMNVPPADVHVHERGESLEFVSYKVLPFDVRTTAEATWTHFKGVEKHLANGSLYEKAEKGLDEPYTIIADFKKKRFPTVLELTFT